MAVEHEPTEAPLVVGDEPVGPGSGPAGAARTGVATIRTWWVVGLGAALVSLAMVGLSLRPPGSTMPAVTDSPVEAGDLATAGSGTVDATAGPADGPGGAQQLGGIEPARTVTVWSLPDGIWTWWPLAGHVVFVSSPGRTSQPRVFVHDKVSGRSIWSAAVVPGRQVEVRDPRGDASVRFTMPGDPVASGAGDTSPPDVDEAVLVLSVRDGRLLDE